MNDKNELTRKAQTVGKTLKSRHLLFTAQHIADILGVSRQTAYTYMEEWRIRGIVKRVEKANRYFDWYWLGLGKDEK